MTMVPIPPTTRAQAIQKAITRISYKHGEAVVLLIGIVIGFVMGKL
jgi:hypothetical protein